MVKILNHINSQCPKPPRPNLQHSLKPLKRLLSLRLSLKPLLPLLRLMPLPLRLLLLKNQPLLHSLLL